MRFNGGELAIKLFVESLSRMVRSYLGDGVKFTAQWDRSGVQEIKLSLSKSQKYTAIDLFGMNGRFAASAPDANVPVNSLAFGYRMSGRDVIFDIEPITVVGLVDKIEGEQPAAMGSNPSGIDPITAISLGFTIIRLLITVLNPTLTIQLGGRVEFSAVLKGDSLIAELTQPPSVVFMGQRLTATKAELTPDKLELFLTGAGWFVPKSTVIGFSVV